MSSKCLVYTMVFTKCWDRKVRIEMFVWIEMFGIEFNAFIVGLISIALFSQNIKFTKYAWTY